MTDNTVKWNSQVPDKTGFTVYLVSDTIPT